MSEFTFTVYLHCILHSPFPKTENRKVNTLLFFRQVTILNNNSHNESKRCQQETSSFRRASLASITSSSILGSPNGHINGGGRGSFSVSSFPMERVRMTTLKIWENAKTPSFYARDNVSNFLQWSRFLSVRVLFETEDLVLHSNPKNVVLCLLDVARIVCKTYCFSPTPGLVELEREIDAQIEAEEKEAAALCHPNASARNNLHLPLTTEQDEKCSPDEDSSESSSLNKHGHENSKTMNPSELPSDVPPRCPSPSAASLMSTVSIASARSSVETSAVSQKDLSAQLDQKVITKPISTSNQSICLRKNERKFYSIYQSEVTQIAVVRKSVHFRACHSKTFFFKCFCILIIPFTSICHNRIF